MTEDAAMVIAMVDRHKLTDTAFVNVESEQIGLCVDLVYSCDDYDGWGDSIFISLDEKYGAAEIEAAKKLAKEIGSILKIPVKENIKQMKGAFL